MVTFLDQLLKTWGDRGPTSLYRVFLLWLAVVNWRFIYILFWEESAKIRGLRTDVAVQEHFFQTGSLLGDAFANFAIYMLPAFIATVITIWYLPYIKEIAYQTSLSFLYRQKKIRLDHDTDVAQYRASRTTDQAKAVVQQKRAEDTISRNLSEEEKWEKEAEELRNRPADLMAITIARSVIYGNAGLFTMDQEFGGDREYIAPDILARIDTLEIVDIEYPSNRLSATRKGKFLFRFVEKHNLLQARG